MKYYYNEQENSFYIATNFIPKHLDEDWVEITEEEYNRLQEERQNKEEQD